MPFYWMNRRIPELEALRARGLVSRWTECRVRLLLDGRFWLGLLPALAPVGLGWWAARELGDDPATLYVLLGLGVVLGALFLRQVAMNLTREKARNLLQKEFAPPRRPPSPPE